MIFKYMDDRKKWEKSFRYQDLSLFIILSTQKIIYFTKNKFNNLLRSALTFLTKLAKKINKSFGSEIILFWIIKILIVEIIPDCFRL